MTFNLTQLLWLNLTQLLFLADRPWRHVFIIVCIIRIWTFTAGVTTRLLQKHSNKNEYEVCCTLLHRRQHEKMFHVYSPDGSTFLREMTPRRPSWNYDVKSDIQLSQLKHIYTRNIAVKFHPDPFWNDGVWCFFEDVAQQAEEQEQYE